MLTKPQIVSCLCSKIIAPWLPHTSESGLRGVRYLFSNVSLRWTNKKGLTVVMKGRPLLLKQLLESDPILITFIVLEVYIRVNDCSDEGIQEEYGDNHNAVWL